MKIEPFSVDDWEPTGRVNSRGVPEFVSAQLGTTIHYQPRVTPVARVSDPATAHYAARRAKKRAVSDLLLVLQAHIDAGPTGLTGEELERAVGRPYQSVGPRRPTLERRGLLIKRGVRVNSRGNPENVYVATVSSTKGLIL